ncbi:MAG: CopD family protein [Bacteroidota bacterium]
MAFFYIKALHIIFIVTWFAGLFYIVRIFIYQTEASQKIEPDRSILVNEYKRNAARLWLGITWPSAVFTFFLGFSLVWQQPSYLSQGYMHVKLTMVLMLYIYHGICHRIYLEQKKDIYKHTSQKLRFWNEVATILLVGIVFLIVLKNTLSMVWGLVGLVIFTLVLVLAIRIYKKVRERNEQ